MDEGSSSSSRRDGGASYQLSRTLQSVGELAVIVLCVMDGCVWIVVRGVNV